MSSYKLWYMLMTGIFLVVTSVTVYSVFQNDEREWSFPTHVFVIALVFAVLGIIVWKKGREHYPYAYLLGLCSLYAFVLVILTMIQM
ncbi:hypothetical protein QA612_02315 [Evansella sp. AB-P1]|uniref:hypothetical protein n=1 Tax=Evansella sp. AB-P1 TaxID=3037653 RepID=UPI0024203D8F|nr:hypothetical protein [Evansella sp. AB-P1]MDG5786308.1 hypothetical protein [Evansella sp. AB-P1]